MWCLAQVSGVPVNLSSCKGSMKRATSNASRAGKYSWREIATELKEAIIQDGAIVWSHGLLGYSTDLTPELREPQTNHVTDRATHIGKPLQHLFKILDNIVFIACSSQNCGDLPV